MASSTVKKANQLVEYTPDNLNELKKCSEDPVYFIENYVKITHPVKGLIPFDLYNYQIEIIKAFEANRFTCVRASRQLGKTTMAAAYFLWYAAFKDDKTILIVSNNMANASEFIHRLRSFYEELPMWLKPGVKRDGWSKTSVGFDTGSRIISRATSESSARGLALSLVFADELAFVRESIANEFWTSLSPVLSTGGSMIIASTPDGDSNLFARLSIGAELGTNDFIHYKYIWSDIPERDEAWKLTQIGLLGPEKFRQEHEVEFISSTATLVSSATLQQVITVYEPLKNIRGFNLWSEFEHGKKYIIGVDPATGTGNDYSVAVIFEFPSMIQVGEFRENTTSSPTVYKTIMHIIKYIESCGGSIYWSLERNGVGEGLLSLLEIDDNNDTEAEFISESNTKHLGFYTTKKSKMKSCLEFKNMLETGKIFIKSKLLLAELKNYVRTRTGYEAKNGSTDDIISAVLIVIRIIDEIIQYDDDAFEMISNVLNDDFNDFDPEFAAMPILV